MTETLLTPREVADRGRAIYEQRLRTQIEAEAFGQYLVIDVASGEYELGGDHLETARRARAKNPRAKLYGMRIGYPATVAIGTTLRPVRKGTGL